MSEPRSENRPLRAGSLCTGIGGLDLAVEQHFGAEMVWCAEYESHLDPIIQREFGPVLNLRDLTTVAWDELEPVDVLSAGYPCQPFSHAGKRKGSSDVRHLWPHIAEAVRVLRPRWVVLENVAGHLTLGFGDVLRDLAEAGFDAEWCLLRASDVGAPHQRVRIFIVATDADQRGRLATGRDAGAVGRTQRREAGGEPAPREPAPTADDRGGHPVTDARSMGWGPRPGLRQSEPAGERRGRPRDHDGEAPADPDGERLERRGRTAPRRPDERPARPHRLEAPPDPDGRRQLRGSQPHVGSDEPRVEASRRGDADRLDMDAWGPYAPAIQRWELVLGRPAPAPTDDRGRLNPPFVEWMMGYPEGWVDGLTRTQALKALGNAVVPQQGLAALRELAPLEQEAAA